MSEVKLCLKLCLTIDKLTEKLTKMTTYVLCKTGSLAVLKVTARDQGHYKGLLGAFVTYCNISCFFNKIYQCIWL